jgi:CheY-like chemotaxis protein
MPTILIVDDHDELRNNLADLFEFEDYRVITAANGESAVQLAREYLPDLITCDVHMPGLTGFEVLQILRSIPETKDTPFVFITSVEQAEIERAGGVGVSGYIHKPFDISQVLGTVRNILYSRV